MLQIRHANLIYVHSASRAEANHHPQPVPNLIRPYVLYTRRTVQISTSQIVPLEKRGVVSTVKSKTIVPALPISQGIFNIK